MLAGAGLLMAVPERAAAASPYPDLAITSEITNGYGYDLGNGIVQKSNVTGDVHLRIGNNVGGFLSEIGLDLTSRLAGDDFTFLHNGYCIGTCGLSITTSILFTFTNSGDQARNIRFDSLITPGHLAEKGTSGQGDFDFQVLQYGPDDDLLGQIYGAHGLTGGFYDQIDISSGGAFNGLFRDSYSEGAGHFNAMAYSDWSATNLNLDLFTIDAHSTSKLLYVSQISLGNSANCTDLSVCDGVQIAFGDPRNGGGGSTIVNTGLRSLSLDASTDMEPLLGRSFVAYTTPSDFVKPDTALPTVPPVIPAVTYGAPFVSQVPEPASWALMIGGFALAGAALRRRMTLQHLPV